MALASLLINIAKPRLSQACEPYSSRFFNEYADLDPEGFELKDWGRPKTLENECALQVLDDEDLYDNEAAIFL